MAGALSPLDEEDWLSDAEHAAASLEDPLVWMRRPVTCVRFEVVDAPAPALRIGYRTAGTADGPNEGLAEIVVSEGGIAEGDDEDVVAVTLFERVLAGTPPSGHPESEKAGG